MPLYMTEEQDKILRPVTLATIKQMYLVLAAWNAAWLNKDRPAEDQITLEDALKDLVSNGHGTPRLESNHHYIKSDLTTMIHVITPAIPNKGEPVIMLHGYFRRSSHDIAVVLLETNNGFIRAIFNSEEGLIRVPENTPKHPFEVAN